MKLSYAVIRGLVICFLCSSSAAIGADSTGGLLAELTGKASIVITTEPLRGKKADVEINGKRVVSIGVDETYKALHDAGKTIIVVKGDKVEFDAQPNKEYVFEIAMRPPSGGANFFLGIAGTTALAEYSIALKATRELQPAK